MHSSHAYFWAPTTGALHPPGATIWTFVFSFYMAAFYWCYVALQLWRYHLWILEPCSYLLTSSSRVSSSPRTFFLKSPLRLFRMGKFLQGSSSPRTFFPQVSPPIISHGGAFVCLFSKPLPVTYIVKAAAPVQKSWKGNTVEAQLNNRSRGAMLKVLKRQHCDA